MPEVLMSMPNLPPGKRYTGEMRPVNQGEQYRAENGEVDMWLLDQPTATSHPIVADIYQRPDWMLPGWLCEDARGWKWYADKPTWDQNMQFWSSGKGQSYTVADKVRFTTWEFTPPVYTGGFKDSLTEV